MRKVIILLFVFCILIALIPEVDGSSMGFVPSLDNGLRQGDNGTFTVKIFNNGETDIKIEWLGLHFEWLDDDEFFLKALYSYPVYIPPKNNDIFTIDFTIGTSVPPGEYNNYFKVIFQEEELGIWQPGSFTSSVRYNYIVLEKDYDGDGVGDSDDDFPNNSNETTDSDLDGVGNNTDMFPFDSTEWFDSDNDGIGDNTDAFPYDNSEYKDSDLDGVGDNRDEYPFDSTRWYTFQLFPDKYENTNSEIQLLSYIFIGLVMISVLSICGLTYAVLIYYRIKSPHVKQPPLPPPVNGIKKKRDEIP